MRRHFQNGISGGQYCLQMLKTLDTDQDTVNAD